MAPDSNLDPLRKTIAEWTEAYKELSKQDKVEHGIRVALQGVPFVGSALVEGYWGAKDKRWRGCVDETLRFLSERLETMELDLEELRGYYATDEFAALFEATWMQIRTAAQRQKLEALRGALLSIVTASPQLPYGKQEFFLQAVSRMGDLHIHVLQLFEQRMAAAEHPYITFKDICDLVNADSESNEQFVYSVIDVLANLRLIVHGNIPRVGTEGAIDFPRQRFRCTELGAEFLRFVRNPQPQSNDERSPS